MVVCQRGLPSASTIFGIVHNTGHAVRVGDVLGSVEVVHGTVQRGVAVIFNVLCSIQVRLGNADFAQGAVIFS